MTSSFICRIITLGTAMVASRSMQSIRRSFIGIDSKRGGEGVRWGREAVSWEGAWRSVSIPILWRGRIKAERSRKGPEEDHFERLWGNVGGQRRDDSLLLAVIVKTRSDILPLCFMPLPRSQSSSPSEMLAVQIHPKSISYPERLSMNFFNFVISFREMSINPYSTPIIS